jgi:hypothetical protein
MFRGMRRLVAAQAAACKTRLGEPSPTVVRLESTLGLHLVAEGHRPSHMTIGKQRRPRARLATIPMYETQRT